MEKKKKIILWAVVLLVTHAILFIGGSMRGKKITQEYFDKEFEKADAQVILGHYSAYRDIALSISAAQDENAKCEAELRATAMFDSLQYCLKNDECKQVLTKKALVFAPEVLGEKPFPIMRRSSCN